MPSIFTTDLFGLPAATLNLIAFILIAIVAVLVLVILYRILRRPRFAGGRRSRHARLAVTDAALIDERRKLVLVRRDDVEHLVLIGGASDLVIESDIRKTVPAQAHATPPSTSAPTPKPAPAERVSQSSTQEARPPSTPSSVPHRTPVPNASVRPSAPTAGASADLSKVEVRATRSTPAPAVSTASATFGSASATKNIGTNTSKESAVDQMDALLDEITPKK